MSNVRQGKPLSRGFSLVELIIVVVIVGLLAAIAIPRFSRGASAASENATLADLAVLRQALDMYAAEHNGNYPGGMGLVNSLTLYSNAAGSTSEAPSELYPFGPYVHAIPELKSGPQAGSTVVATIAAPPNTTYPTPIAWLYLPSTGQIWANDPDLLNRGL
ncbi:prepilin-type N-terminal cleavage/methylation domain-containing protein [Algisphaera agarilytica]|uniref:Prepilin-type N-terminal cleavage/methylation domain-containing protein n=1 Tax=Algisphaera agarilytica TaxID=1385975 RepID=A0A7X0H4G0_9BACT|nr:prepilin-type N-terminal cleavage/methylation domain-containing protein [Algisphaera agarilytica]MBB6429034.1 prepilin-type N-terminal cleavage/methylation domain-containing protein [Algisphaera agarilytica]